MMKKYIIGVLLLLVLASFCACTTVPTINMDGEEVARKLDALDAYRKAMPTPVRMDENTFRKVAYGSTRAQVMDAETLELMEEYTNALDYEYTHMFSYQMIPTYWFNEADIMFRGSYYMQSDVLIDTIEILYAQLKMEFGDAVVYGYYTMDNDEQIVFDTAQEGKDAITRGEAYYYMWFETDTDIEMIAEIARDYDGVGTPVYDFYINYTDYNYTD